jgi:hypothetical protein
VILRLLGAAAIATAFTSIGSAATRGVPEQQEAARRPALFIALPMTNGFADATDALVETKGFVHEALGAVETVRLVDRMQDSEAVLTVLGRGTGYVELTAVLQGLDPNVVVSPVMLHAHERYIEAMLAVGSCGEAATSATKESKSPSCYRKIFVGLDDRDARQAAKKGAPGPWTVCANALARDVQAWVAQNAGQLLAFRH